MTGYDFIFSNKLGKRLYRHFAFWILLAFHFIIQNLIIGGVNEALKGRSFAGSAFNALFFFPVYILSVYILIYLLLPVYLFNRKYILFFCWLTVLLIFSITACYFSGILYIHIIYGTAFSKITFESNKYNTIVNGLFLPIVIYGIAGGIKLTKKWYVEQKENERLAKEKITRELQLLKIQLHPRFLFHSLHTVKKHIHSLPSLAASLILQLSDLLSYVLYESNEEWVLLEKELDMIKRYIDLEKRSSENFLKTEVNISGDASGKYIFPVLLLSFIENSFDYFLKDNNKDPSLQLSITIWDTHLDYHLICNRFLDKTYTASEIEQKFISLEKQLQLMYPKKYQLEIINNTQNITVILNLPIRNSSNDCQDIAQEKKSYELL